MGKVVITRRIPPPAEEILKSAGHEVVVSPMPRPLSREELKNFVVGADGILSLLTDKIDGEVMDAAGDKLKIIANYAVGFDNINLTDATQRKIVVTNTPGVLTEAVAEHTFALILSLAKNIVEADKFTRSGGYQGWEPELFLGQSLYQKTIGIIGAGRIGGYVAKAAQGFSMKIIYHDVRRNEEFEKATGSQFVDLMTLLSNSDIVTIHVPLTSETKHLLGAAHFPLMKKTALLINTSRGGVIDEEALVSALQAGTIGGAGLDVYENEPRLAEGLTHLKNVILTPHTASATLEARSAMSKIAAENIVAVLSGQAPLNPAQ
ncbi:MAG TPA: D-glycerate dehydrogenase [Patescibacteria group bacterium]|nr:D-glycerate dehydrogenase [Patescibacteria group bacterium]